jgi:mannose-6-phosphate isomerase-like protein (cupin superfamily)
MKFAFDDVLALLPGPPSARWPEGEHFVHLFKRHDLSLELYAPQDHDPQQPHTRDELYIVVRGQAHFIRGSAPQAAVSTASSCEVSAGDVLFVPAGQPHRFDTFSADFATWVLFFGPERPPEPAP